MINNREKSCSYRWESNRAKELINSSNLSQTSIFMYIWKNSQMRLEVGSVRVKSQLYRYYKLSQ